jgi:hypothetical protein
MARRPPPEGYGKIRPVSARPDNPKNSVYKQAVISPGATRIGGFAGDQRADTPPLLVGKFAAFGFHGGSRSSNLEPHESKVKPVPESLNVDWS